MRGDRETRFNLDEAAAPTEGGLLWLARELLAAKGVNLAPDMSVVDSDATSLDRVWAYDGTFAFLGCS